MKKKFKIFVTALICIFCLKSSAQINHPWIDSLKILPKNPTINDTVKVLCFTNFYMSFCKHDPSSITIDNFLITVTAPYYVGDCQLIDTIPIGKLEPGDYKLIFHLHDTQVNDNDNDSIEFKVTIDNGIIERLRLLEAKIYPNPILNNQDLNIFNPFPAGYETRVNVYDLLGRQVFTYNILSPVGNFINIPLKNAALEKGSYIVEVGNSRQEKLFAKLIIKD